MLQKQTLLLVYMYLQVHMYNYICTTRIHNMVCKLNDLCMKFGSRWKVETTYNQVLVAVGMCIQSCILSNLGLFVWCHCCIEFLCKTNILNPGFWVTKLTPTWGLV